MENMSAMVSSNEDLCSQFRAVKAIHSILTREAAYTLKI